MTTQAIQADSTFGTFFLKADETPASAHRLVLVAIVTLSILIRVIYFLEISASPVAYSHLVPPSDMHFFDAWAKSILSGDTLTDKALHPLNRWQRQLAQEYFRMRPDTETELIASGVKNPARALWNRWYGGKRFHQEPLYPYLVALTYRVAGPDVRAVFVWQMFIGILTNVLIYFLARRFFGSVAASMAAVMALLYSPLLFYETVLLRSTLITFTTLLILFLADSAIRRNSIWLWFINGIVFGLAIMLKMSLVLIVAVVLVVFCVCHRRMLPVMMRNGALIATGSLIILSPLIIRNTIVGVAPLEMSSVGAVTFACTNTVDYSPDIPEAFPCSKKHVPAIMGETDGEFFPTIVQTLRTHTGITSYFSQVGKKFLSIWNWYETPNNVNYYFYQQYSRLLRYLPLTFAWVGLLGGIGMGFGLLRLRELALLYAVAAAIIAPMLLFYALSRFRAPLAALMIPFAAAGLLELLIWTRRRLLAGMMLLAGIVLSPILLHAPPAIRSIDHLNTYQLFYQPRILTAAQSGETARLDLLFAEALRNEPDIASDRPAMNANQFQSARVFYRIRHDYAQNLRQQGRNREADEQVRRAEDMKTGAIPYRR